MDSIVRKPVQATVKVRSVWGTKGFARTGVKRNTLEITVRSVGQESLDGTVRVCVVQVV